MNISFVHSIIYILYNFSSDFEIHTIGLGILVYNCTALSNIATTEHDLADNTGTKSYYYS